MSENDTMRDAFEHWASDEGKYRDAIIRSGEGYKLMATQTYWHAWKACDSALRASMGGPVANADLAQENKTLRAAITEYLDSCNLCGGAGEYPCYEGSSRKERCHPCADFLEALTPRSGK